MVPAGVTLRTRCSLRSAIYRLPAESTATAQGSTRACVDGPPSPTEFVVPANVVTVPPRANRRMRLLSRSATYTLPEASRATATGLLNLAAVAAEPSPLKPATPVPAMVAITPLELT